MTTIRLGLIGAGEIMRLRAPLLVSDTGAVIAGVAEPSIEMRELFAEAIRAPGAEEPLFFDDHRALLESVELDGVVIASPHGLHFQHAADALAKGCHALVYKPMVTTSGDAKALADLAEQTRRTVSIAIEGIYSSEFRHVRAMLEAGELGEIQLVVGTLAQDWLSAVRGTWRTDPLLGGGGNLIDSGYHLLAALLHLTGKVPNEVFAYVDRAGEEFDVFVAGSLRFDGAVGAIAVSGDAKGMNENIYLHGSEKCLNTSVYGGRLEFVTGWSERQTIVLPAAESAEANFVRCVRGEAETLTPAVLGLELALVIEALYRSAEQHAPVRVVRDDHRGPPGLVPQTP
jgi:predicted dehydrogenase